MIQPDHSGSDNARPSNQAGSGSARPLNETGSDSSGSARPHLNKAVFLDRDGVITNNTEHYYLTRPEDLVLNPGVIETLKELRERGYLLIMITNQGGIATGHSTVEDVEQVHQYLRELLEKEGITLEEIYYCPHHQQVEACLCRKPMPLMLEKGMARFRIDPARSYFIGDSDRDMEAGKGAGVQPVKVTANADLRMALPQIH